MGRKYLQVKDGDNILTVRDAPEETGAFEWFWKPEFMWLNLPVTRPWEKLTPAVKSITKSRTCKNGK